MLPVTALAHWHPAPAPATSGNPYPFTNPPFYVISHGYDMDITTSGIFFSKMSYPYAIRGLIKSERSAIKT